MGRRQPLRKREANGQRQRKNQSPASEVRRLREAAWRGLRDAQWGTELGRLYLEGKITEEQYSAGRRWRDSIHAYHKAIDIFPIRGVKLERGSMAMPPDPDSKAGQELARREVHAIEAFFEAYAILSLTGAEKIVRALVEAGEPVCGTAGLLTLRKGLSHLAAYYGIERK